jgi:AcrR family transcriptional regulator
MRSGTGRDATPAGRSVRAPRADAQRNRARVLAAAEQVFAEQGTSVSTEEVAKAAGVGIGTVFRHFPTKAELLEAVFLERIRRFAEEAAELTVAADPSAAFWTFLTRVAEVASSKNAYAEALEAAGADLSEALHPARQQLPRALGVLLRRAQEAGAVREDVGVPELIALMAATSRITDHGGDASLQERVRAIVFDGLRPAGRLSRS